MYICGHIIITEHVITIPSHSYRFGLAVSVLDQYDRRRGSCIGGDIKGIKSSLVSCAHACDALPECVGFVYVPEHDKMCWLKREMCQHVKSVRGATIYIRRRSWGYATYVLVVLFVVVAAAFAIRQLRRNAGALTDCFTELSDAQPYRTAECLYHTGDGLSEFLPLPKSPS